MRGAHGVHDLLVQARLAGAAVQDEAEVAADFGKQVPTVEPPPFITNTRAVTSTAARATPTTAATRARIAAAAARARSSRDSMTLSPPQS
ncbi:hypothetical protein PV683_41170 [Streptomyces sp. AK08-01B]|uniref:hypothetical protein n=1 Tax=Streptomyces sp. AK08-01B TaxID=3028653 RepID=UPI0029B295AD|nr:hypothetical protein [Streptomyces sp. AK08-01B]MDX3772011.1 hypothetical protein [Streptomyces sp. AK08-01B]MDX3821511.1 hypothetical protein [Streptomyces sp. AK08-01A]